MAGEDVIGKNSREQGSFDQGRALWLGSGISRDFDDLHGPSSFVKYEYS